MHTYYLHCSMITYFVLILYHYSTGALVCTVWSICNNDFPIGQSVCPTCTRYRICTGVNAVRQCLDRWPRRFHAQTGSASSADRTAQLNAQTAQLTCERERVQDSFWIFVFYVVSSCFGPLVLCKIDFILHFCISCWLAAKSRWFIVLLIVLLPRSSWHSASFK